MNIKNVKIGTDFEMFLQNVNTKEIVSAEGLVAGTKNKPFPIDEENKDFAISLDNVSVEGNIPPATTAYEFYKNVQKTIEYINSVIPPDLKAVPLPAARLAEKYVSTEHAQILGCESDLNAYTGDINPRPNVQCKENYTLRSSGGHLHLSYNKPDPFTSFDIIKALDLFIGVPSVILEPDNERKKLYGKAGACRLKKYGVEYRSPSNFYLQSETLTTWVFESAKKAIDFLNNDGIIYLEDDQKLIVDSINNKDCDLAKKLINKYSLNLI